MSSAKEAAQVSVILRTKDRPRFLARALGSLAAQTFRSIQLVVVNDGGAQEPVNEALAGFRASNPDVHVHVVHNEVSQGRAEAINLGLAVATAALYVLHDDDDTWQPEFLARTVAYLAEHPEAVAVATRTWVIFEHEDGDTLKEDAREILDADQTAVSLLEIARRNYVATNCVVIRRAVSDQVGSFKPEQSVHEDWDFLLRLLCAGPIGFIPGEPLANWHHRRNATGAAGNSVFGEAVDHHNASILIRDAYLRDPNNQLLGHLLPLAYYTDQLNLRLDGIGEAIHLHYLQRSADANKQFAAIAELAADLKQQTHSVQQLQVLVLELTANLEEAHEKLDRLAKSPLRRFFARITRTNPQVTAPLSGEHKTPEAATTGPLVVPPAPTLAGSRWLDDDDYENEVRSA